LALDEDQKIKIPAALNTYLRNYQREGVRFLWRQYKRGQGGLLGDDMGLVSYMFYIYSSSDRKGIYVLIGFVEPLSTQIYYP